MLFTDIVGSTDLAVEMGDARWRELIARHHGIVRQQLRRFGGREIDTAGDGFFVTFEKPTQALRCAAALVEAVRALGIEIRAGLHLGEVEIAGKRVGGIAVHTGARVLAAAAPAEVLVTGTLRELVAGAGLEFVDRGIHTLKGVPGDWHLSALVAVDGRQVEPPSDEGTAAKRREAIAVPTLLRRRRKPAAVGAFVLVLVLVVLMLRPSAAERRAGGTGREVPPLNSVVQVDPDSGTILHVTPNVVERTGGGNPKLVIGEGGVWIHSSFLAHVDPVAGSLVDRLVVETTGNPAADRGVEVGYRAVWVGGNHAGDHALLFRWDPATDERLPDLRVPSSIETDDLALGFGAAWIAFADGHLVKLDPDVGKVVGTTRATSVIDGVVVGANAVWVLDITDGTLTRVDPGTLKASDPTGFSGSILGMAADDAHVWLLEAVGHNVIPIDANGNEGYPIPVGPEPSGIAVGLDAVWVSDEGGDVYRIDPLTREVTKVHVGGHLTAIAVDEESDTLWMTVGGD